MSPNTITDMRSKIKEIELSKYEYLSFDELDKKINKLEDKLDYLWQKFGGKGTWEWYCKKCEPTWNEYDSVLCQWILKNPLEKISKSPLKDIGDLFTIEEFKSCCKAGGFIESDGEGYYVKDSLEYDLPVRPSFFARDYIRRDFTHVMWYNK